MEYRGSVEIFILLMIIQKASFNTVKPSCSAAEEICEIVLFAQHRYTMVHYSHEGLGTMLPVEIDDFGHLWTRRRNCSGADPLPEQEAADVVIGDGSFRLLTLLNNSLPAPPIVVYEGQQVAVKLINNMENEGTTLHFHGIHQHGTPWMDGADGVSQCSIIPGETFTYRFLAEPVGTHWYHSHQGTQRTMGAYGPLIVLPREEKPRSVKVPEFEEEFYLMLQDYMRRDSLDIFYITTNEAVSFAYGFGSDYCFNSTKQADGFDCGVTPFVSGIINGKGRHYSSTGKAENANLPLEHFTVKKGKFYKLRIISASMTFGMRLSVDGHRLNVIAADGYDVESTEVESVVIFSGERYDVWFEANDSLNTSKYWIRAETLERTQNGEIIHPGHTEAILQYEGCPKGEPITQRHLCSKINPCKILNCPYRGLPTEDHSPCITVSELRSPQPKPTITSQDGDVLEHFLNFHFSGKKTQGIWRTTINGIRNKLSSTPLQLYRGNVSEVITPCETEKCLADICRCTHILKVPLGKVVQLNLAITVNNPDGVLNGNNHPVHIHGTTLQVLKTGWPEYDNVTHHYIRQNDDIICNDDVCNRLYWRNATWKGGNVPGITLQGAPSKDTVVIPIGGYIVTRFLANNPGFWYMHCHTEFHNLEGMSLVVQVGDVSDMPPPPAGMKSCGNFHWTEEEYMSAITNPTSAASQHHQSSLSTLTEHPARMAAAGASVGVLVAITIGLALWYRRRQHHRSWNYIPIANPHN